jgi:hypothetical protein
MVSQGLHEKDFHLWLQSQAIAIQNRDIKSMDWENLLEEIEDMGASQKRAIRSYYYRLVEHILKLSYWEAEKERNEIKWRVEVSNFRTAINDLLEDSPSLNNYLKDNHLNWFNKTVNNFTKNKLFTLKDQVAIPLEKLMDEDFFG